MYIPWISYIYVIPRIVWLVLIVGVALDSPKQYLGEGRFASTLVGEVSCFRFIQNNILYIVFFDMIRLDRHIYIYNYSIWGWGCWNGMNDTLVSFDFCETILTWHEQVTKYSKRKMGHMQIWSQLDTGKWDCPQIQRPYIVWVPCLSIVVAIVVGMTILFDALQKARKAISRWLRKRSNNDHWKSTGFNYAGRNRH